jgi:hypothetical protein
MDLVWRAHASAILRPVHFSWRARRPSIAQSTRGAIVAASIRVALVGLTPLIRDVVHSLIAKQKDMHVTAVIEGRSEKLTTGGEGADVVLVGVSSSAPAWAAERLLSEPPPPRRVVGISYDGRQMQLSELQPATAALGSLSPDELLEVIRGGRRSAAGTVAGPINTGV